jgi:ribonuclease HI
MKSVIIYTDGACRGNPGPGGWGAVLMSGDHEKHLWGGEPQTTNNRMELSAAIHALNALQKPCQVALYTDSVYVQKGMTLWLATWKKQGWRNASKQPVKNVDLWQALEKAVAIHQVTWHWVKGHNGDKGNTLADELANRGVNELEG